MQNGTVLTLRSTFKNSSTVTSAKVRNKTALHTLPRECSAGHQQADSIVRPLTGKIVQREVCKSEQPKVQCRTNIGFFSPRWGGPNTNRLSPSETRGRLTFCNCLPLRHWLNDCSVDPASSSSTSSPKHCSWMGKLNSSNCVPSPESGLPHFQHLCAKATGIALTRGETSCIRVGRRRPKLPA